MRISAWCLSWSSKGAQFTKLLGETVDLFANALGIAGTGLGLPQAQAFDTSAIPDRAAASYSVRIRAESLLVIAGADRPNTQRPSLPELNSQ